MKNEELFINITPGEAPDLNMEISSEEKAQLTANVLAKIENKQKKQQPEETKIIRFSRRLVSMIAAAVLLVVSTSAIATISSGNFKNNTAKKKETQNTTQSESVELCTKASTECQNDDDLKENVIPVEENENQQKFVYVNADNLADYTMTEIGGGWYSFENNDNTLNFDCQIIYSDIEWSRDDIVVKGIENSRTLVPEYQWMYLNDRKALYVKYKKDWMYSQQLFVRYRESKYALSILAPSGISKSQLLEIGKKVTLDICPQSQGSEYIKLSGFLENYRPDEMKGEIPKHQAIDYSKITYPSQSVMDSKVLITVEAVTNQKNMSEIIKNNQSNEDPNNSQNGTNTLLGYLSANMNLFANPDGTLCSYERSYVYVGDGINTPKQKIVYQKVQQEFYKVRLRIKNLTTEKISDFGLLYPLKYISDDENFYYDTDVYSRPAGVNSCQINNQPRYFSVGKDIIDLEAGQEQIVEIGYFVDEDLADNMLMSILGYQVDIR